MENLTLENLIDLREAADRRIQQIDEFTPNSWEAKREQERRRQSLTDSLKTINAKIHEHIEIVEKN